MDIDHLQRPFPPLQLQTVITHFHCPEVVTVCSVAPVSEKWLLKKTLVPSTVIVWPVQALRDHAVRQNIPNNLRNRRVKRKKPTRCN